MPDPVKLTPLLNGNTQIITSMFKLPPPLAKAGKNKTTKMKKFKMPTLNLEVSLGKIPNIDLFSQLPNCQELLGCFVGS